MNDERLTIGIIAAVDPNWVIGVNGTMPWHSKADFKRFKARTMGSTLIMGKATWESLPKPLPGRRTLVLTRQTTVVSKHPMDACEFYPNMDIACLAAASDQHGTNGDVWFAGGAQVYKTALEMPELEFLDLTVVPEVTSFPDGAQITKFPHELLTGWGVVQEDKNPDDPTLLHRIYHRVAAGNPF